MKKLGFLAFSIWFLLQPFTVISGYYLGTLAVDKLMAPILIVLGIVLTLFGRQRVDQGKIAIILLAFVFFFIRNISKIDDSSLYPTLLWEDAILFGYFCLPILYVNSLDKVATASKLIAVNATVACVSAFMVAFGWLTLPYERFEGARFDLAVEKSIGLFPSYGDVAQYSAFFLLLALFAPFSLVPGKKSYSGKLVGILAFAIIVMGLIGNQSRSLLLSLIVSLIMALIFHYRSKGAANKMLFNTLFLVIGMSVVSFAAVTINRIISLLASMGGKGAEGTAMGRLAQHEYAFRLIGEYPILGVDGAYYAMHGAYVSGIHNMWLGQLARGGFISAMLLLAMLFFIFRISLKLLHNPKTRSYGTATIGYMFSVLVSTLFYPANTQFFWALLGMNAAIVTALRSSNMTR